MAAEEEEEEEGTETSTHLTESLPMIGTSIPANVDPKNPSLLVQGLFKRETSARLTSTSYSCYVEWSDPFCSIEGANIIWLGFP